MWAEKEIRCLPIPNTIYSMPFSIALYTCINSHVKGAIPTSSDRWGNLISVHQECSTCSDKIIFYNDVILYTLKQSRVITAILNQREHSFNFIRHNSIIDLKDKIHTLTLFDVFSMSEIVHSEWTATHTTLQYTYTHFIDRAAMWMKTFRSVAPHDLWPTRLHTVIFTLKICTYSIGKVQHTVCFSHFTESQW